MEKETEGEEGGGGEEEEEEGEEESLKVAIVPFCQPTHKNWRAKVAVVMGFV